MSDFNINEDAQSGGEYSGSQSSCNEPDTQPLESAFPDEDEETITMLDVIEREDKLEEEASAVLGNSDAKNCTYPKGYIPRQALYSCATCFEGSDKMAAICLACSLECHDNHEVFELYTKRNYRCDCGNSKFKTDFECKLIDKNTQKAPINEKNSYNHNFLGRYCTCDTRYPPDENDNSDESNDEMWQCIVCEDWYHTKHLGVKEFPNKFDEMICGLCVGKLDFIHYYRNVEDTTADGLAAGGLQIVDSSEENNVPQIETSATREPVSGTSTQDDRAADIHNGSVETKSEVLESDTNDSQAENKDPGSLSKSPSKDSKCILQKLKNESHSKPDQSSDQGEVVDRRTDPLFWLDCSWRSKLCRCEDCMIMYKEKGCEYLLDDKDTVQYYEAQGKAIAKTNESPFERGMSALNGMNRTAVVEALHGYNELKADFSNYFREFAAKKKVVREEDIHDFFAQLKSKKRPRLDQS